MSDEDLASIKEILSRNDRKNGVRSQIVLEIIARLEAAEAVCNFYGAWNLGAEVAAQLNNAFADWQKARGHD